jgi:17 kDa outer membrane surface antigen
VAVTDTTKNRIGLPLSFSVRAITFFLVAAVVSSCTSGSLDLFEGASKVDRSIATATVPKPQQETVSDQVTILNAVTSTDLAKLGDSPLPWANTATGSAGVVSSIREDRRNGTACRDFVTTRHAFDGIAQYHGRACLDPAGRWMLVSFAARS